MNTIEIQGQEFTEADIIQLLEMARELLNTNETLNANIIAMNAKLENEEKKVQKLQQQLLFISHAFTNNTYEA
jgi:mannose/fructose/N-acetylgalactosamine-specific phosphotransferase system component IID